MNYFTPATPSISCHDIKLSGFLMFCRNLPHSQPIFARTRSQFKEFDDNGDALADLIYIYANL